MHIFLNILKMQMNICLRDLPTRKKSRLPSRAPTHAYADCEISGQQPTQLYKEFPRVHEAGHSKKNAAHVKLHFTMDGSYISTYSPNWHISPHLGE